MERVGFFADDTSEPVQALEEQVLKKKLFKSEPAGLEIAHAGVNPGIGQGIRRVQALNRMDIPSMWRALIRPPIGKNRGPEVSLLAPSGITPPDAAAKLTGAGVAAASISADAASIECGFEPGTSASSLVAFAVAAVTALQGPPPSRDWQWTVRAQGAIPR